MTELFTKRIVFSYSSDLPTVYKQFDGMSGICVFFNPGGEQAHCDFDDIPQRVTVPTKNLKLAENQEVINSSLQNNRIHLFPRDFKQISRNSTGYTKN